MYACIHIHTYIYIRTWCSSHSRIMVALCTLRLDCKEFAMHLLYLSIIILAPGATGRSRHGGALDSYILYVYAISICV